MTERMISTNGIDMHIHEAGPAGAPLVVLCHGFPELGYSWRHQLPVLAEAGYHAVAPDQRGYGGTSRPPAIEDYDIVHLTDDLLGLLDALGESQAVFVGHDWGSPVVSQLVVRAPERVRGAVWTSSTSSSVSMVVGWIVQRPARCRRCGRVRRESPPRPRLWPPPPRWPRQSVLVGS